MIIISSAEFRENQKSYFDKVDQGIQILVKRSKQKAYRIVPVSENDILISNPSPSNDPYFLIPENIERLQKSLQEAQDGKVVEVKHDEIEDIFDI
ncbi:MAG: prevent-host-death protein [Prevotellaceae bacterium]|jgi:PHD/YefM family antitoxin component YafN of YafNO toxin-antitoxin module|nr:prevent-host-death protein [Prevotellaceae bacterium]